MITVSVCMIVKNEEAVLARCLDSLRDIADEIIIVDTGSTDATKQIASNYTEKIYDFIWIDDFAVARNEAFAKATMEYIYTADADEVIDEENRQRFLILKQTLLPEIEIVQMKYANQLEFNTTYNYDAEYRPKLYKRLRTFRYTDPVHESVVLKPVVYDSDITILHMPQANHSGRDFKIYQKAIKINGGLSPRLYEMYARELFISGEDEDFLEAAAYYESFSEKEVTESERKIFECVLVRTYRIQNNITGLMKYSLKNLAEGKPSCEVCYELGEYFYGIKDYKEASVWFYNAAYEAECELNIRYSGDYPLSRLADCFGMLGDRQQEDEYRNAAIAAKRSYSSKTQPLLRWRI